MSQPPYSTNRHLQDVNNDLKAALEKANERIAELEKEVKLKHDQRSDLAQWFEHRSVYGELTLEQIDAMSPRQLADHCYERKAEQVEVLTDKVKALTKERDELKVELCSSSDLINEVAAYGNCECNIPRGEVCIPCQCALQVKANRELLNPQPPTK